MLGALGLREGLADAVLLTGSGDRAALLLGAAVALRGTAVTGDVEVAGIAERARDLVGAEAFAETYARPPILFRS